MFYKQLTPEYQCKTLKQTNIHCTAGPSLAGAVPTALHTVEDLLLQFLPLLLFPGQPLALLVRLAIAVQDLAVLRVPQV